MRNCRDLYFYLLGEVCVGQKNCQLNLVLYGGNVLKISC